MWQVIISGVLGGLHDAYLTCNTRIVISIVKSEVKEIHASCVCKVVKMFIYYCAFTLFFWRNLQTDSEVMV